MNIPLHLLPNVLTVARMLAVVPLVGCLLTQRYEWAFGVALIAGLTDGLDGHLARRFGWQSRFGGWADPAADKLLMSAVYVTLAFLSVLPVWLGALVIAKDTIVGAGALAYRYRFGPFKAAPTVLSKATTFAQLILIWYALLGLISVRFPVSIDQTLIITVACMTLATLFQYVWVWSHKARCQQQRASMS